MARHLGEVHGEGAKGRRVEILSALASLRVNRHLHSTGIFLHGCCRHCEVLKKHLLGKRQPLNDGSKSSLDFGYVVCKSRSSNPPTPVQTLFPMILSVLASLRVNRHLHSTGIFLHGCCRHVNRSWQGTWGKSMEKVPKDVALMNAPCPRA
jgi:hypothetical protein